MITNKFAAGLVVAIGAYKLWMDIQEKKPLTSIPVLTDAALLGAGVKLFF